MENYEEFTDAQKKILEKFVTSTTSDIFALKNLPEVIKGALFSRYSRSSLSLRSLLLKEFVLNEETAFHAICGDTNADSHHAEDQMVATKKAQNFYDRILDGYGDDSIGELGSAHLALENISMLAAKVVEDCRIGGSPLEKSTRYVYFDQKINGEYLFYREPVLMTSAFKEVYIKACNQLFDSYSQLIPPLTEIMEKRCPKEPDVSNVAYTAALRAKVLDCLRGLLPASSFTNMGVLGNGRFFEAMIQKLNCHNLAELQEIGKKSYEELHKIIPSFIRRGEASHKYQKSFSKFMEATSSEAKELSQRFEKLTTPQVLPGVRLIHWDEDAPQKIAAALLFPHAQTTLKDLEQVAKNLPEEDLLRILDAACSYRENRRHKSPRALEHASFTFEIVADFGVYRDLQRHRMQTQDRQNLTANYGYYIPAEIRDTDLEKIYREAMDVAKEAYDTLAKELPEEAQYVVPMAYNIQWYFHINLRSLQWLTELRSTPQGHPEYRFIAQEMAKLAIKAVPSLERFFKFVDFEGYELGRLGQEIRIAERMQMR